MQDWAEDDRNLLNWRALTAETNFEKTSPADVEISDQEIFIGKNFNDDANEDVDMVQLIQINEILRYHPIAIVGAELRAAMNSMKQIALGE